MDFKEMEEYHLLYEMMMKSLKTDDVIEGINKSLYILKAFINSGGIVLYKKNKNGVYVYDISDEEMKDSVKPVTRIVNQTASLIETKQILNFDLNFSDDFMNMLMIYLKTVDSEYVLAVKNNKKSEKYDDVFWRKVQDTMLVILKRAELYEKNTKAMSIDSLTNLDNRNIYERDIRNLESSGEKLVYALFDLFRLKYVNDNYSHALGDEYIKQAAKILQKYWPKENINIIDGVETATKTGHCVYRLGGDEFALITTAEDEALTNLKAELAAQEISMIDLGIDNLPVGINYGISTHNSEDHLKDTYEEADKLMAEDKKKMYGKYGLNRRR